MHPAFQKKSEPIYNSEKNNTTSEKLIFKTNILQEEILNDISEDDEFDTYIKKEHNKSKDTKRIKETKREKIKVLPNVNGPDDDEEITSVSNTYKEDDFGNVLIDYIGLINLMKL